MNEKMKYWYLRDHQLFSQLNEQSLQELSVTSGFIRARRNEKILFCEEKQKWMYILKKGIVKIVKLNEHGEEQIIDVIAQGDIFGQLDFFAYSQQFAKVLTDEVIIFTFSIVNFEKMIANNPSVAIHFLKRLNGRIHKVQRQYSSLIFKDAKTRLTEFLKDYCLEHGIRESRKITARNYLTHQDIGDMIGCKRQTVSSLLKELVTEKVVCYTRSELVLFLTE